MTIPRPNYKQNKRGKDLMRQLIHGNKDMPSSRRVCLVCDRLTTFMYNRVIGHSECKECGNRHVKPPINNVEDIIPNLDSIYMEKHDSHCVNSRNLYGN